MIIHRLSISCKNIKNDNLANHFTMTVDFINILFFITSSVSINHGLGLITTKKLSLLLCTKRTNPIQQWQGVLWDQQFHPWECSNHSAMIPYYERYTILWNGKMNTNELKI